MDVKAFFKKISTPQREPVISKQVKHNFASQFPESRNTEWNNTGDQFEAVFYQEELEHIARYTKEGALVCLKINLPLTMVPPTIAAAAAEHGELMNAIAIEANDGQKFELIVRNTELIRYTLLMTDDGELIEKEKL